MRRVVVTGMGVIAPTGNCVADFAQSLRKGLSGVKKVKGLRELGFRCQVAAVPEGVDPLAESAFAERNLRAMDSVHRYAALAALEAWSSAGLSVDMSPSGPVDWDSGAVIGTGVGGMNTIAERVVPAVNAAKVRSLGGRMMEQCMASGVSARVGGILGLGNQVTTNSSACATGSESIIEGAQRIRNGDAERMLCGGAEGPSRFIWAGFDSMRVLASGSNTSPTKASRPMSASATGFVPAARAGVLDLESLASALGRSAPILAEYLGGAINSGGQRNGGTMTAPNQEGRVRCIRTALDRSKLSGDEVDLISGHLTATGGDSLEIDAWRVALGRAPSDFPLICAPKSMIGHALGAAGAIETIATILMLKGGWVHPSINCEDLHPKLADYARAIPREAVDREGLEVAAKVSFGFGDVNTCVLLRRWQGKPHAEENG